MKYWDKMIFGVGDILKACKLTHPGRVLITLISRSQGPLTYHSILHKAKTYRERGLVQVWLRLSFRAGFNQKPRSNDLGTGEPELSRRQMLVGWGG